MGTLGSFGTVRQAPEDPTFEWFGMQVRVAADFGEITFIEWMDSYGDIEDGTGAALLALLALLRGLVHADDFDEFWSLAKRHRQTSEDLTRLVWGVVEAIAGRPTERSSESASGPQKSGDESTVTFLRRVSDGRPEIAAGLIETALARGEISGTG